MYGLIGNILCHPGQRDTLAALLAHGTTDMPGCRSYVIAHDLANPDGLWVTEVWIDAASHKASLGLPAVQAAIASGRPLIAGFGQRIETRPVGAPLAGSPAPD